MLSSSRQVIGQEHTRETPHNHYRSSTLERPDKCSRSSTLETPSREREHRSNHRENVFPMEEKST
ncbi:hypothetical protein DPEC_G00001020 [Dallia pectoralis]|uniref:Uncharacterized protein n=1 Tax=Dallia pectoralis TaxID=75939 RepID=A0ACC2HJE4_DALPE|nr:hypothetical protein DPEC_G00001020 [Dallia pectoralis]